jgi:hypothetical protein
MRGTLRTHITSISIVIFAIVYCYLNYLKPAFLYNKNGTLREFGIGFKRKTVVPLWLITIFIAIMSYFSVLYYIESPNVVF